jgi:hypothetical protein
MRNHVLIWNLSDQSANIDQLKNTFAVEVKAHSGTLELSSNSNQILG